MRTKIKVSVVGCSLVDRLYSNVCFTGPEFALYQSKKRGDGGLTPGQLVFKEEFEEFGKGMLSEILIEITNKNSPDKINIGGPGIVPLIHASQMLDNEACACFFYGCGGKDTDGEYIVNTLKPMNLSLDNYHLSGIHTPATDVLSDPNYNNGHGERIFINSIASGWEYSPKELNEDFFTSDIVVFGGTALVPNIHDNLTELLEKAKSQGSFTIVNTVYDFRNEKKDANQKWPLGKSDDSYHNIDLLIIDCEEALRLSGKTELNQAMDFFQTNGTKAVIITNGSQNIRIYAMKNGSFKEMERSEMPVSDAITRDLTQENKGDTTGCGDNFVGGVIFSVVSQVLENRQELDLEEACIWGIVSGGYACFYTGGTYFEKYPGEKREKLLPYYEQYKRQVNHG